MAEVAGEAERNADPGWPRILTYGFAHFGKSLFWTVGELLLAFFLTEVAAIAPHRMGLILAAGFVASAGADLLVGFILRGRITSPKAAARLQLIGAMVSSAALLATFASYWTAAPARADVALIAGLAFRVSYALYDVPQNALVSLAAADGRGRTRLVATRYVFTGLAGLTVAGLTPLLLDGAAGAKALRFCGLTAVFSLIAIASAAGLDRALGSGGTVHAPAPFRAPRRSGGLALGLLLGVMFIQSLAAPVFSKIEPYYAAYVLHAPLLGGTVLVGVALGTSLSQPAWTHLCRGLSRQATLAATAGAVALAAALFLVVKPAGGVAAPACGLVFGAACGGLGMATWAAFGDLVAEQGRGREAMSFALFTASSKLALALGALWIGAFLSGFDYRGGEERMLVVVMAAPAVVAGGVIALIAGVWTAAGRRGGADRAALMRPG